MSTESARENRELKRKVRELERTIEVLKAAMNFFVAECAPQHR
ncbi:putative RNase H-like nuclease (RuvC/YqgF family) [Haloactinomyces albus]|uniref:RNase H-like nuclease (RuvC/YqgF family) n=1 Tax=Haloactinomyces albus TaxID=1352928 RepID=A0AAE4CNK8_9ACTN|nr:putative RNase H-like nuclease (RuvC/YqgF family) [Haloactinomyces albus]